MMRSSTNGSKAAPLLLFGMVVLSSIQPPQSADALPLFSLKGKHSADAPPQYLRRRRKRRVIEIGESQQQQDEYAQFSKNEWMVEEMRFLEMDMSNSLSVMGDAEVCVVSPSCLLP